jgi:GNAT superfamily N-acetyltransferase
MIRAATPDDIPAIRAMIRELAEYERAVDEARATEEQLREALFGAEPVAYALIAQEQEQEEQTEGAGRPEPAGFALWFRNFSTWTGSTGLYLEDLYVRPEKRGAGHGKALLAALAAICVERGYPRFEWSVLDWNEKALGVYRSIGALPQEGWTVQRLTGPALSALAAQADSRTIGSSNQASSHAH